MASVSELSRRELQKLCKQHGLKASGKTADMAAALAAFDAEHANPVSFEAQALCRKQLICGKSKVLPT